MDKRVTYRQLDEVLKSLGYVPQNVLTDQVMYRHPGRRLFVLVPREAPEALARPLDLLRAQNALVNEGVIQEAEFDSLFRINKGDRLVWTEPRTGRKVKVTAAAGESDGLVVIQQNGTLTPCPADQLRKADAEVKEDAR
ncbi:MAG TPA: hypothetical protein VFE78_38345 [Gemmataceae bacterium]|jgi:hypothetical protein|nr:hypothetical protein [Gemmataceae bacterium]